MIRLAMYSNGRVRYTAVKTRTIEFSVETIRKTVVCAPFSIIGLLLPTHSLEFGKFVLPQPSQLFAVNGV